MESVLNAKENAVLQNAENISLRMIWALLSLTTCS